MLTEHEVKRLLDAANAGLHKGEVAAARTIYEGILAGRPGHAPALISLALSHIAVGECEQAEAILRERVLAANPDDADALAYLGLALSISGRAEEAEAVFASIPEGTAARKMASAVLEARAG